MQPKKITATTAGLANLMALLKAKVGMTLPYVGLQPAPASTLTPVIMPEQPAVL